MPPSLVLVSRGCDVKNDISWEDIIPLDQQQKFEKEEDQRKVEELAAQESRDRKRSHAPVSYEGMELKERDVHVLIRSLQRWGDIRQRYEITVSASDV
jgi:chromodomain-helicase-DNA-binding protein 1